MLRVGCYVAGMIVAVGAGCVTTHHVSRPASVNELQLLSEEHGGLTVVFHPADPPPSAPPKFDSFTPVSTPAHGADHVVAFDVIAIRPEGVWVEPNGGRMFLKLGDIQGFQVKRHGTGALEGLGIGTLAGLVGGALAGYLQGDDPPCMLSPLESLLVPCLRATAGDKAILGGIAGTFLGAITGALTGAIIGHTDRYLF